ncbi:excinuclease ABC subunit UvrA [archaeon]|jgi:excinuclease ABC subunit A|nr:excinuclease ABC subunit UvrA [archaeon]MBT6698589.1 excinuclease ABC subunit UvrA [archaeon]
MLKDIIVKGARQHNLKNIDVKIPRNKLTVITGLSGSGKSSLAFDTIYAEGQRRYVESLSAYARQFLGIMNKPDIDSIEGLSPAISIEQKTTSKNPRSTVGTVTEIYDYLRLLYARIGTAHCPKCSEHIKPLSAQTITSMIMAEEGKQLIILAPITRGKKGTHEAIFDDLIKEGFNRVRVDGKIYKLDGIKEEVKLERYEKHWIEAVIDRITVNSETRLRLSEAVESALQKGEGKIIILDSDKRAEEMIKAKKRNAGKGKAGKGKGGKAKGLKEIGRGAGETLYSNFGACPNHPEITFEELEPRMFSFNSPFGACKTCAGIGRRLEIDPELLIPNPKLSIIDGAIAIYGKMDNKWRSQQIGVVGKKYKFDIFTPISKFTAKQLDVLLYGTDEPLVGKWSTGANMNLKDGWEGIIPQSMRLYRQTESNYRRSKIEKFMRALHCKTCEGKRLKDTILSVKVDNVSIIDITDLSIERSLKFFRDLPAKLNNRDAFIAKQVLKEIIDRLHFLENVGLGYLNLSRAARTLSGGEAQRIRLATQIGANLMGVLYILDEPSIGLHQKDNAKLISTLHRLRDLGNTLIVVEHDEDTMRESDYLIDLGPGAGVHGGSIVAQGTPKQVMAQRDSVTGQFLLGKLQIKTPELDERRDLEEHDKIILRGCSENNLHDVDVAFPTRVLCAITGVSGSGKSTLMNQTFIPAVKKHLDMTFDKIGKHKSIHIPKDVRSVIVIDQEPIGRTPRSNPATYTKIFDQIRVIYSLTKESKLRGYKAGRFSFNMPGGRCEDCHGDGLIKIEMNFLPDVFVTCDSCKGKRYNKDTLDILYKEKNIADVLNMTVDDALKFFENHPSIGRKVQTLYDVGLGYIKLGQSATTLSGGESQRIKLTRELSKVKKGHTVYLLDEPTTGLHFEDVRKLLQVLNRLVDKGNSIYVIEHNLDVIKSADYVIDLGPEGGEKGGQVIATGTPEELIKVKKSFTGHFLKKVLK